MSDRLTSFFDRYLSGNASAEEIDDYVDEWHDAPADAPASAMTLHDFLGLTWDEYAAWVEDAGAMPRLRAARLAAAPGVRRTA